MNKRTTTLFAAAAMLSLFSWSVAQSPKPELFDTKKSQQELEIMRGILSTTLNMVTKELRGSSQAGTGRLYGSSFSNIGAFYLYGQGATFTIPMSSLRATAYSGRLISDLEGKVVALETMKADMEGAEAQLAASKAELEAARALGAATGVGVGVGGGVGRGSVAVAPVPPAQPTTVAPVAPVPQVQPTPPPQPPQRSAQAKTEDLQKRLAEAQEQMKKRREEFEKQSQKLQEILVQLKGYLIEALANYGDSLTVVKPNEYINLVISTDTDGYVLLGGFSDSGGSRPSREIISVQRSMITDYKAGRITLEGFKQKVLQYNE